MSKNVMSQIEMVKVLDVLREHCHKIVDTDCCQYDEKWNDQRIADLCEVTLYNVQGLRKNILGDLIKVKPSSELDQLRSAVTKLIAEVIELRAWASARPVQPFGKK